MILASLGDERREADLVRLFDAEWYGVPASRVRRLAKWGYQVTFERTTIEQLRNFLGQGRPCIIFLRTSGLPGWTEDVPHAVVLVGLTEGMVYIHDPTRDSGPMSFEITAFLIAWSEMDYYCATIQRSE